MATLSTLSETQALNNQVANRLRAYESFTIQSDVPGIEGYTLTLRTNIYVHRVHTQRDTYSPASFYAGTSITALPSIGFMRQWLENNRKATLERINKGVYKSEEIIGGEWQSVDRKYNRWAYYDGTTRRLIGEVHQIKQKGGE
jgi:hypothetical protein